MWVGQGSSASALFTFGLDSPLLTCGEQSGKLAASLASIRYMPETPPPSW